MCWCVLTFVREGSQATAHFATKHFNNKTKSHIIITTAVSYTHLRAHETGRNLVCRLLLEKKKKKIKKKKKKKFFFFFFFNDTATTEIYTLHIVGSVRCV